MRQRWSYIVGQSTQNSDLCRKLQQAIEALETQLVLIDDCGSSLAGTYLSHALDALHQDLMSRCVAAKTGNGSHLSAPLRTVERH